MKNKYLVVDDQLMVLDLTREILLRHGHEALLAREGAEAVRLFEKHADEIAAVILDIRMPDMDGCEVFDRIKAIRPGVPIVLTSGYAETDIARQGSIPQGFAGYVQKPFSPDELIEALAPLAKKEQG